jgi:uncharacterized membrane protein
LQRPHKDAKREVNVDMINPFDLRTVLLEKHAQHVVFIHFPIALFISGVVFDVLSRGQRDSQLAGAAYLNLSAAAMLALPTVITGLLAWQFALKGARLHGLLLLHVITASLATMLIIVSWFLHWRARERRIQILPSARIAVEMLGVVAVVLAAHFGGFVSGINS